MAAPLAFPTNPALYQTYSANGKTWFWDGQTWIYGTGPGGAPDPNWASVTFLCRIDDALGQQVNVGSSGGAISGTGLFSTTITRYSTLSILVNGNLSQGLAAPADAGYAFGTGDFTLNLSIYPTVLAAKNFWDFRTAGSSITPCLFMGADGSIGFFVNGATVLTGAAAALAINTWADVELARVSGVTRLFVNGTQSGANYTDANSYVQNGFTVGNGNLQAGIGASGPQAYFGQVRVTKGIGRHSANFTNYTGRFPNY